MSTRPSLDAPVCISGEFAPSDGALMALRGRATPAWLENSAASLSRDEDLHHPHFNACRALTV